MTDASNVRALQLTRGPAEESGPGSPPKVTSPSRLLTASIPACGPQNLHFTASSLTPLFQTICGPNPTGFPVSASVILSRMYGNTAVGRREQRGPCPDGPGDLSAWRPCGHRGHSDPSSCSAQRDRLEKEWTSREPNVNSRFLPSFMLRLSLSEISLPSVRLCPGCYLTSDLQGGVRYVLTSRYVLVHPFHDTQDSPTPDKQVKMNSCAHKLFKDRVHSLLLNFISAWG